MCLIAVKSAGIEIPKKEYLINAHNNNSEGIGIAHYKKGKKMVNIKKDFVGAEHLHYWLMNNVKKEDVLVIHFRKATSGLVDCGNRHPFSVTRDRKKLRKVNLNCKLSVAHNGVLFKHSGDEVFSDTQKFILDILARKEIRNNLNSLPILKLIKEYIGSDKLAFLSNTGDILLIGEFIIKEGILYSNTTYEKSWFSSASYGSRPNQTKSLTNGLTDEQETILEDEEEEEEVEDSCYVCAYTKKLAGVEHDGNTYLLCKKCRRKLRRGKLSLEEAKCAFCDGTFLKSTLKIKLNKYLTCKGCDKKTMVD